MVLAEESNPRDCLEKSDTFTYIISTSNKKMRISRSEGRFTLYDRNYLMAEKIIPALVGGR